MYVNPKIEVNQKVKVIQFMCVMIIDPECCAKAGRRVKLGSHLEKTFCWNKNFLKFGFANKEKSILTVNFFSVVTSLPCY